MLNWCLFSREELTKLLGTDLEKGLSSGTALLRTAVPASAAENISGFFRPAVLFVKYLAGMFTDIGNLLLISAAVIFELSSETGSAALNVIVTFFFLCALLRAIAAYVAESYTGRRLSDDEYRVLRDGVVKKLPASRLVRGDVVILGKGEIVPFDMRLCETENFCVIEFYNGKRAKAVNKDAAFEPLKTKEISLRLKKNMAFRGSAVTSGTALAVVTDPEMSFEKASKTLGIPSNQADYYTENTRFSFTGTRTVRRNSFGNTGTGASEYEGSTESEIGSASRKLRILSLVSGFIVLALTVASKVLMSDAFLFASAVMGCVPAALCDLCSEAAFAVGCARLKGQGIHVRDYDSCEKLVMSDSVLCSGSTAYSVSKMVAEACYIGRNIEFSKENARSIKRLSEYLLCSADLWRTNDKNGLPTIEGTLEGLACLDAARSIGAVQKGDESEYIEHLYEFRDINGSLGAVLCELHGKTVLVTRGSVSRILRKCAYYEYGDGIIAPLDKAKRERAAENAKAYENNESCRVVAVAYKYSKNARKTEQGSGFVFVGFVVFGTIQDYSSAKYVGILRKFGITPVIFSGIASDMVLSDAEKLGVMTEDDNYLTFNSFSALDEKIYADDIDSYTVYMGLGAMQKRRVVRTKKYSRSVVTAAVDKPGDAFDFSDSDVLMACGGDVSRTLRRICDVYSESNGLGIIFRTVCICRNIVRCSLLSARFLVASAFASVCFGLLCAFGSFALSGALPVEAPVFAASVLLCDTVFLVFSASSRTPKDIISCSPESFGSSMDVSGGFVRMALAGGLCGTVSFISYMVSLLVSKDPAVSSASAVLTFILSKCPVAIFSVLPKNVLRHNDARYSVRAGVGIYAAALTMILLLGKKAFPIGLGSASATVAAVAILLSFVPFAVVELVKRFGNEDKGKKRKGKKGRK